MKNIISWVFSKRMWPSNTVCPWTFLTQQLHMQRNEVIIYNKTEPFVASCCCHLEPRCFLSGVNYIFNITETVQQFFLTLFKKMLTQSIHPLKVDHLTFDITT